MYIKGGTFKPELAFVTLKIHVLFSFKKKLNDFHNKVEMFYPFSSFYHITKPKTIGGMQNIDLIKNLGKTFI